MKRDGLKDLLDILYPTGLTCALCGREIPAGSGLCPACAGEVRPCGTFDLPGLDGCAAAFLYEGPVRGAIHRFKYENQRWLTAFFASALRVPAPWRITLILPVPLHPNKLRARGYNQSALLAGALSMRCGIPVNEALLVRLRDTHTQTELPVEARRENMRAAFGVQGDCANQRILLLDDVCTTGSTLCSCAAALRQAGTAAVYAMTVAAVR